MAMPKDYDSARDEMTLALIRCAGDIGIDRAKLVARGITDAITEWTFHTFGPGGRSSIGIALDNTKPDLPTAA